MSTRNLNWRVSGLLAFSLLVSCATPAVLPASAADDTGSLDSMWMDQKVGGSDSAAAMAKRPAVKSAAPHATAQPATAKPAPTDATISTADAAVNTDTGTPADTAAPMCSVDAFKNSALISKGGWPGVGPFKPAEGATNEYTDGHSNRVKLDLNGDQVTRAEMQLSDASEHADATGLLGMQMNIDFLMEAVGIKPKKIQDLNRQLAKNKDALLRPDQTPLNLTTGRFQISIGKEPQAGSGIRYTVAVNSLDANKNIIKQHSLTDNTQKNKNTDIPGVTTFILRDQHSQAPDSATSEKGTQPKSATSNGDKLPLKDQFASVINEWQKVKKGAVRLKQTDDLSTVLSGKALARQTDAVKWLQTNHKSYDMNPKGVVVDQFTELATGKKYMVAAQVHEAYKFIDDSTGKVLKEVDDVNKVNYTIEKINGKWLITDSALLSTATKTSSTSKGSH